MVFVVACFEYQRWIGNNSSRLNLAKFESHINSSDAVIDSPAGEPSESICAAPTSEAAAVLVSDRAARSLRCGRRF
jgi:hypothetical protein